MMDVSCSSLAVKELTALGLTIDTIEAPNGDPYCSEMIRPLRIFTTTQRQRSRRCSTTTTPCSGAGLG